MVDPPLRVVEVADSAWWKVSGAVDLAGLRLWSQALRSIVAGGSDVHLDLSELSFIDGRGMSELMAASRRLPDGHRIIVHQPCAAFRRLHAIFWSQLDIVEVDTREIDTREIDTVKADRR